MKTKLLGLITIAIIATALIGCGGDDKNTHTHEWEWVVTTAATPDTDGVETETCKTCGQTNGTRPIPKITCKCPEGTTHEPNEKCCEGKDCICPIAEPTVKKFLDKVMFVEGDTSYKADIIDARTKAGSKTLEQLDINVVKQLQDATTAAYNSGSGLTGAQIKSRFRNVFGSTTDGIPNRVVITIDNDATNTSYITRNKIAVSFNIDYLLAETTTAAVLQAAITAAVTEMNGKPLPPLPWFDENGVPYYGTLPNTTIKIYKGDATITDTQMTTVLARIQTSYTDGIIAGNFEADFQRIIKSIRVTLGTNIVRNGNIIEFGCDAIEDYPGTAFAMIAMGLD